MNTYITKYNLCCHYSEWYNSVTDTWFLVLTLDKDMTSKQAAYLIKVTNMHTYVTLFIVSCTYVGNHFTFMTTKYHPKYVNMYTCANDNFT